MDDRQHGKYSLAGHMGIQESSFTTLIYPAPGRRTGAKPSSALASGKPQLQTLRQVTSHLLGVAMGIFSSKL